MSEPRLALARADVEKTLRPVERATMLPPAAFADPAVLDWELDSLFRGWVCAGHASRVAEPGSYLVREIGTDSVVVMADEDGRPHAFLNVCRHRGARVIEDAEGSVTRGIRCPYHGFSYGLDGSLVAAPHMEGVEDFDPSCWGLIPVRSAQLGGLLFVDLSGEAPDIAEHVGELVTHLDHYRTGELRRAGAIEYAVEANWKSIAENYSECLHCPGVHPELNRISDYMSGEEIEGAGAWCGGSMILREGYSTMAVNGGDANGRPPIAGLSGDDLISVLYLVLFPNALVSFHPDYVMLHTLWPREPGRTDVTCEWFFEPRAIEAAGFDPSDAIDFWDKVNRQDWYVCELTQKGVRTRGYVPGRYSAMESDVHNFDVMVAERYMEALRESTEVTA